MKKLFFFGDSICFGHMVSIHETWVSKISKELEGTFIVNNPSHNGDTTDIAIQRMNHDIIDFLPDYVFLQFGMNDCNVWETLGNTERVNIKDYTKNICFILSTLRFFGIKPILSTNHTGNKDEHHPLNVSNYNNRLRKISSMYDVPLIEVERYFKASKGLLLDGVHLSRAGHKIYFNIVYPQLEEILNGY